GHLLEICRASGLAAQLDVAGLPFIDAALALAKGGVATGASTRNWASYGEAVHLPAGSPEWLQKLVTDPQTSGGLLIACDAQSEADVLAVIRAAQGHDAWVIGRLANGPAGVTLG